MKNRLLYLLLGSLFLAAYTCSNVFAAGLIVDYAKSVNATDGNDSFNFLVSSTSDGGYIVSTCMLNSGDYGPNDWYSRINDCDFYLSKYKVDGSREWMTAIDTRSILVAIGEMADDYRIMTDDGRMMAFAKDSGQYLSTASINLREVWDAGFYLDDTVVAYGDGDFFKYDKNGNQIGAFPFRYGENGYCNFSLATFSNGDFAFACGVGADNLIRVSRDLTNAELLFNLDSSGWIEVIDEDKYVLTSLGVCDAEDSCRFTNTSYDMNGNILATMQRYGSSTDSSMAFVGGYYFVNNNEHTIKKLSPEFEPIFEYSFNENEAFYAAAPLKDRSVIGVGLSSAETTNYTINSDSNGIYYRWIDEDVPVLLVSDDENGDNEDPTENPNTLDDIAKNGLTLVALIGCASTVVLRRRR